MLVEERVKDKLINGSFWAVYGHYEGLRKRMKGLRFAIKTLKEDKDAHRVDISILEGKHEELKEEYDFLEEKLKTTSIFEEVNDGR